MSFLSIGDLAQTFHLRRQSHEVKTNITRLSQELSTGLKSDVSKAVSHDFSVLSGLERSLSLIDGYKRAATEARVFTEAAQSSLAVVQSELADLGPAFLSAANNGHSTMISAAAAEGQQKLEAIVGALNTSVSGRRVFAGRATDTPPLADVSAMIDALRPAAQAAGNAADLISAVDAWFAPGGDFETTAYQGSDNPVAAFLLSDDTKVTMNITANRPELRQAISSLVLVSLIDEAAFSNDAGAQRQVMEHAATGVLTAQSSVSVLRAELGATEAAVAQSESRLSAQKSSLGILRADILAADPFETATELEHASTQLESLYLLTSRISRLKLTDFL